MRGLLLTGGREALRLELFAALRVPARLRRQHLLDLGLRAAALGGLAICGHFVAGSGSSFVRSEMRLMRCTANADSNDSIAESASIFIFRTVLDRRVLNGPSQFGQYGHDGIVGGRQSIALQPLLQHV